MLITIKELKNKVNIRYRSMAYRMLAKLPILPKAPGYKYDLKDIRHTLIVRNTRSEKSRETVKTILEVIDEELAKERDNTICGVSKQDRENNL